MDKKLTRLEDMVGELEWDEFAVVELAAGEFRQGETYKTTECPKLRERLLNDYAVFKLYSYRHFNYLPKGHYLRDD